MPEDKITPTTKRRRQKRIGVDFLEVHHGMGTQLNIDADHVIVDREDYVLACAIIKSLQESGHVQIFHEENKNQYRLFNTPIIE